MKYIFLLFLLYASAQLQAQKREKITWHNDELQTLVQPAHGLFIAFERNLWNDEFKVMPDSITPLAKQLKVNVYDFDFLGDRVLFEQQFGKAFPAAIIDEKLESLQRKNCYLSHCEGRIYPDSIVMEIRLDCTNPDDDEKIFYRVKRQTGFQGDRKMFELLLEQGLSNDKPVVGPGDSVLYIAGVIKRDSMFHDAKLLGPGDETDFSRAVIRILEQLRGWKPAVLDGSRIVNSYRTIYIRLRPDGTIEGDYERNY